MTQRDVGNLVGQDRRDFGRVVGEGEQPAGDVEPAVRQGKGVDDGRVEDRNPVGLVRPVGGGDELRGDVGEEALRGGRAHLAPEGRDEAGMVALGLILVAGGARSRRGQRRAGRERGAGGDESRHPEAEDPQRTALHRPFRSLIAARGPPRGLPPSRPR